MKETIRRRVHMDYDWKCQPHDPGTGQIGESQHLAFTTRPWTTVAEFLECRKNWETFYSETGRCLRTEHDLSAFLDYLQSAKANENGLNRSLISGSWKIAQRQFLSAWSRSEWGLSKGKTTQTDISSWLSEQDYPTSINDVKNRSRKKPIPGSVPRTDDVHKFVEVVRGRFPSFESEKMLGDVAIDQHLEVADRQVA